MKRLADWMAQRVVPMLSAREPDFIITGPAGAAYLHRFYVTRWRGWFAHVPEQLRSRGQRLLVWVTKRICNVYVHRFVGDDPQDVLHDHPSWAISFIFKGAYVEHTIEEGGVHRRHVFRDGTLRAMSTRHAHRIELLRDEQGSPLECWTLFFFGPALREWGFHCPRGWVHWKKFVTPGTNNQVQQGCGE